MIHTLLSVNISSRVSRNSEAFASKFLETLEEMFPLYYMHSDVLCMLKSTNAQRGVNRQERVNR